MKKFIIHLSPTVNVELYADRASELLMYSTHAQEVRSAEFFIIDHDLPEGHPERFRQVAQYSLNNILGWREADATSKPA